MTPSEKRRSYEHERVEAVRSCTIPLAHARSYDENSKDARPFAGACSYQPAGNRPKAAINGIVSATETRIVSPRMSPTSPDHDDVVHSESFLRSLMRRQLSLSISCAATFFVALLGLPLLNYFAPELMASRVAGFTLSWLVLGVLFFPFVWIISYVFIKRSIALEEDEVAQAEAMLRREGVEMLSTTHASIEEISSRVLEHLGINREMF